MSKEIHGVCCIVIVKRGQCVVVKKDLCILKSDLLNVFFDNISLSLENAKVCFDNM